MPHKNPEERRAYRKEYYAKHREQAIAKAQVWKAKHHDAVNASERVNRKRRDRQCSLTDCLHYTPDTQTLCGMHRLRLRRNGSPFIVKQIKQHPETCTYPNCTRPYLNLGYCSVHYGRLKRHGDPSLTLIRPFGSGTVNKQGYVSIKVKGKSVLLHRMLLEEQLGRPLRKDEVVHHIDCNPANNSLDNLEVMHNAIHTKMHNVLASLLSLDERGFRHLNNHLRKHGLQVSIQKSLPLLPLPE